MTTFLPRVGRIVVTTFLPRAGRNVAGSPYFVTLQGPLIAGSPYFVTLSGPRNSLSATKPVLVYKKS